MSDYATTADPSRAATDDQEALDYLHEAVRSGMHWYPALLGAVARWSSAEETRGQVRYRYLIGNEAFDWLRLAERLTEEIADFVPAAELEALLFQGQSP